MDPTLQRCHSATVDIRYSPKTSSHRCRPWVRAWTIVACTRLRHTARNVVGISIWSSNLATTSSPSRSRAARVTMTTPCTTFCLKEKKIQILLPVLESSASRDIQIYMFGTDCPVYVKISVKPPQFSDQDVQTMTNQAQLRRRWEVAKQMAGERADTSMARSVDAPDYLNTYLGDSMNPVQGKARIPLLNRKFLKTFGKDCDSILTRLGFTNSTEEKRREPWLRYGIFRGQKNQQILSKQHCVTSLKMLVTS